MSLTLLQITVIKSSSLLEHTAQHVSVFSKHVECTAVYQTQVLRLCNTWTE